MQPKEGRYKDEYGNVCRVCEGNDGYRMIVGFREGRQNALRGVEGLASVVE